VAPTIAISGASNVNEGSPYSLTLGAVTDPGTDTVATYLVHWGDGFSDTYSTNGVKTHTYSDGPLSYAITVDLTDEDGTFLNKANALSVQVNNIALTATAVISDHPAGSTYGQLITFTATVSAPAAQAAFNTVNLSPYANTRIQNYQPSAAGYPEGAVTLGGIPFNIQAVGGNNAWNAEVVSGPYPHVLSIPLNIANATEADTLINTFYGQPGPTSYVTLEFFGTGGAYFRKDLIGNVDIRDHFFAFWTNTINGTTTTQRLQFGRWLALRKPVGQATNYAARRFSRANSDRVSPYQHWRCFGK